LGGTGVDAGMSVAYFGAGRELSITIDPPSGLHHGAGLHRLTFPVGVDCRNTMSGGVPVELRGEIWLGTGGGDWLGTVTTDQPVATSGQRRTNLVLPLTDEQLAVIEQRRAGSDLQFGIDLWATLGFDPAVADGDQEARWPSKQIQVQVPIQSGPWQRLLSQLGGRPSLAVVLPVPLASPGHLNSLIGDHLRDAIRKVNAGEYADAVVAARRSLDVIENTWPSAKSVLEVDQRQRTLEQRLGLMRAAVASLAGPAPHGDPVASSITWNRENALAVIAAITALAACAG